MISILKVSSYFILGILVVVLELRFNTFFQDSYLWAEDPETYFFCGSGFIMGIMLWPGVVCIHLVYLIGKLVTSNMRKLIK